MDSEPEQTSPPSALDRIAAALAELGQDTAAAIAQQAGVGYSTATKRLRLLEEAGRAEAFRADDGRTLWRQPANATASGDSGAPPPAATTAADPERDNPTRPPAPEQDTGTAVAAGPGGQPAGDLPDGGPSPAPQAGLEQPSTQDAPRQPEDSRSGPAATAIDGDATAARAEDGAAAENQGQADSGQDPDLAGSNASVVASGPEDAANAPAGGKPPRRSKGSLRGAIRDVLVAHPGRPLRISQLCKAIDAAHEGSGSARASAGAVVNAVHKLVADGVAVQVAERPAAFQLAATTDD
ncbi:winged helix-turn-helix domain-containing protein [Micromonospora sp. WMMD882]|uniref:winged helix-turn-helix domain-containing protein n=1 Tax=Micromonospora sp. WMMD882 TaxID=3015151 RepID=UPI00248AB2BB|nr:winged helix-turn-helix domain-containing protein [Micromonospora sp. WMMD882]WBB78569.1 winged helix-turn-helix domain-containing protein [Micromonospora sp. WMMD882]